MIETKVGKFEVIKDYRNAFNQTVFEEKYIEEVYDKYSYILGDISGEILRLKGFSSDPKSKNSYLTIPDFIIESCAYECAHFILKRIKEKGNS
ncbi:MAG: YutD-like domain-containing protein [bacterium]